METASDSELHRRILEFRLDDPDAGLTFSERLARENGWSAGFTKRVILEYKRFLILCAEAGHAVTPSDAVDQAWHLHLCYTESYWQDLCRGILGFPLHHGPTKGGGAERAKYFDWYGKTLASYERIFGEAPPADLWPNPEKRFALPDFRRVDCTRNFVIPKRRLKQAAAIAAVSFASVGCSSLFSLFSEEWEFWIVIGFLMLLVVYLGIKYGTGGGGKGGSGCGGFGGGCGGSCGSGCGGGCGGGCGS